MSQPEDREFYRDARDDYHNAMQKLTAGVFSKALKLDADGRPKAEQLTRGFCVLVGRSLLTHLFFLASAARVASLARAGVISHVPALVSCACTSACGGLMSRARLSLIALS